MKLKRFLSMTVAILCLAALLAGCGGKKDKDKGSSSLASSSSSTPSSVETPTPEPKVWVATVQADGGLNIRSGPSTDADILGLAEDGSTLILQRETATDGWFQIEYEGETAYVSAEFAQAKQITMTEYTSIFGSNESSAPTGAGRGDDTSSAPGATDDPSTEPTQSPTAEPTVSPSTAPQLNNQDGE